MSISSRTPASPAFGIPLKIGSALCMTLMLACVKGLDGGVPAGEIAFYRSLVTVGPLLAWILWQRKATEFFEAGTLTRHLGRALSGSVAMFLSFVTIACLPLADTVLLGYITPLMTVVLALLLLKEHVPGYRWAGAIAGAIGVLIALSPHLGASPGQTRWSGAAVPGIASGIAGALCGAMSTIQLRTLAATQRPGAIVSYYSLATCLLGAASVVFGWVMPDTRQLLLMLGAGVFGGMAQLLNAMSLRLAHASAVAPFEYTTLFWSVLISYSLFDQAPGATVIAGGLLVAVSGLVTIWQESRARPSVRRQCDRRPDRTAAQAGSRACHPPVRAGCLARPSPTPKAGGSSKRSATTES